MSATEVYMRGALVVGTVPRRIYLGIASLRPVPVRFVKGMSLRDPAETASETAAEISVAYRWIRYYRL